MPLPPKNVIRNKQFLKTKNVIRNKQFLKTENVLKSSKNFYTIFGLVFLLLIEFLSYYLWDNYDYTTYWYYILNQLGYVILLSNLLINYERLRFCNFKIYGIIFLILYYLLGILAIATNSETFIDNIKLFFIISSTVLIGFSFFGKIK
jgi:hypothetical protein